MALLDTAKPAMKNGKPRRGRPPYAPTAKDRRMVEAMAGIGLTREQMCNVLGIDLKTIDTHFAAELRAGRAKVEAELSYNLLRLAKGDTGVALKAIEFALRCRFGWSEFQPSRPGEALGKKARADIEALTAHESSEWGDLVN